MSLWVHIKRALGGNLLADAFRMHANRAPGSNIRPGRGMLLRVHTNALWRNSCQGIRVKRSCR